MRLDYSTKVQVEVSMKPYMKKLLENLPEEITTTDPTPETENLFNVRDEKDARPLPGKQNAQFHIVVAQLFSDSG